VEECENDESPKKCEAPNIMGVVEIISDSRWKRIGPVKGWEWRSLVIWAGDTGVLAQRF
jgi:hypothetical protein